MNITVFSLSGSSVRTESGRRERKRHRTMDDLAAAAFRLFEARGYDEVTMEQIAIEADVAKGTLYKHFAVKEALLAHHFHRDLANSLPQFDLALAARPDFASRMTYLLHASTRWAKAHQTYLPHYLRFRLANIQCDQDCDKSLRFPRSGLDQLFEALIRAGQEAGELRTELPSAQLAQMFQFLYLGAMMRWLASSKSELQCEFDAVLAMFLHGVVDPEGRKSDPYF